MSIPDNQSSAALDEALAFSDRWNVTRDYHEAKAPLKVLAAAYRALASRQQGEAVGWDADVFKGADGLKKLADSQEFWDRQEYGTRLYFGPGIADYLHRDVLRAAVEFLSRPALPAPALPVAQDEEECEGCDGTGAVREVDAMGYFGVTCEKCKGTGGIPAVPPALSEGVTEAVREALEEADHLSALFPHSVRTPVDRAAITLAAEVRRLSSPAPTQKAGEV